MASISMVELRKYHTTDEFHFAFNYENNSLFYHIYRRLYIVILKNKLILPVSKTCKIIVRFWDLESVLKISEKGKTHLFTFPLSTETFYLWIKLSQVCECQERFTGNAVMAVTLALGVTLNAYKRSILWYHRNIVQLFNCPQGSITGLLVVPTGSVDLYLYRGTFMVNVSLVAQNTLELWSTVTSAGPCHTTIVCIL